MCFFSLRLHIGEWRKIFVFLFLIIGICFFACISFLGLFIIHEMGHIFFGSIGNLFTYGELGDFQLNRDIDIGFSLPGNNSISIPFGVPTQTVILTLDPGNIWMAFGGVILVSIVVLVFGFCLYKITATRKDKMIVAILTAVILSAQILSNCICGTDNLDQTPFFAQPVCDCIVNFCRIVVLFSLFWCFAIIGKNLKKSHQPAQ